MPLSPEIKARMDAALSKQGITPYQELTPSQNSPTAQVLMGGGGLTLERKAEMDAALSHFGITPNAPKVVQPPQPQGPGFFQSVAQGVAKPFEKVASSAMGLIQGTGSLIGAGLTKITGGDPQAQLNQAGEAMTKERSFGYFGKARPVGLNQETGENLTFGQGVKDIAGTGTEIFSTLAGPKVFGIGKAAAKGTKPLLQGIKESTKFSAAGTGLAMAGQEAQRPESTVGSIFKQGAKGVGIGAAAGPIFPLVGAGLRKGVGAGKFAKESVFGSSMPPYATGANVHPSVARNYPKAIRPTVVGRGTLAKQQEMIIDADLGAKEIVLNKERLGLDEGALDGLPASLNSYAAAIQSMKKMTYAAYNGLKKLAGFAGGPSSDIDVAPFVASLKKQANENLSSVIPEANKAGIRALKMAEKLEAKGKYTLEEAQKEVERSNALTSAFWKNQTHSAALKVQADIEFSKMLREALDNAIMKETGGEWQKLRNLYKALKTVEDDVNKRAIVDARKNFAGLIDFTNIFTIGDLISALARLDPAAFLRVMAMNQVRKFIKDLNDPNKIIEKMFKDLAKSDLGESALTRAEKSAFETIGRVVRGEGKPKLLGPGTFKGEISREGKPKLLGPGAIRLKEAEKSMLTSEKEFLKENPVIARQTEVMKNPPLTKQQMIRAQIERARPMWKLRQENFPKGNTAQARFIERKKALLEKDLTENELRQEIEKYVEEFRKRSGLLAQREGAGVNLRPVKDAVGDTQFAATDWSLSRAKKTMSNMAESGRKMAYKELLENDPIFQELVKRLEQKNIPF